MAKPTKTISEPTILAGLAPAGVHEVEKHLFRDAIYKCKFAAQRTRKQLGCIFIGGESGVGKSTVAMEMHNSGIVGGGNGDGRFVAANAAAMPERLFESEMFGHVKGAFTDAVDKEGLIAHATGGTLFVDEIGKTCLNNQAKLLRFIDTGKYRKLGGNDEKEADVVIVLASNDGLEDLVSQGKLLVDLYNRLTLLRIILPPFRARTARVPEIASALWDKLDLWSGGKRRPFPWFLGYVLQEIVESCPYRWPGNYHEVLGLLQDFAIYYSVNRFEAYTKLRHELVQKMFAAEAPDEELAVRIVTEKGIYEDDASARILRSQGSGKKNWDKWATGGIKHVEKVFGDGFPWWFLTTPGSFNSKKMQAAHEYRPRGWHGCDKSEKNARGLSALADFTSLRNKRKGGPTQQEMAKYAGCQRKTVNDWKSMTDEQRPSE